MIPQYTQLAQDYRADETFIRQIEAAVPPGSMIFQLPYVDYVEHPPIHQMFSYDMLRPYLHSRDLRWSYGAMKGRGCAYWQKNVAGNPTDQMLRDLGVAGFAGIYIDRAALTDHGDHLERGLLSLLSVQPLVSENGRFAFFDLAEHIRKLRDQYTDDEWEALKQAALVQRPRGNARSQSKRRSTANESAHDASRKLFIAHAHNGRPGKRTLRNRVFWHDLGANCLRACR
jgi:phosphoglycerol transferase